MSFSLVAFDMDGTLVKEDSCWEIIHREFDSGDQAKENLEKWEKGLIDYPEFMRRDIELWDSRVHISDIDEILSDYELAPNAQEVISELKGRGYEVAIITGGLDILADKVAQELGIPHVLSNSLETDEEGYLTGEGIFRVDPLRKYKALRDFTSEIGAEMSECVGVGDSKYDTSLLEHVGLGIAIGGNEELIEVADIVINDFNDFDLLLDYL
ncbi:MAG: HAD-IB family phosphatase [Hadesarchaea archaeon]|nr:HAD-IB family phosphatase [Hadesarchaea archaeon]